MIYTSYTHWGQLMGRREFVKSAAMAAGALALVPSSVWADSSTPGAIPESLPAVDVSGKAITLSRSDIKDLRSSLRGKLLLSGDEGYEQARRIWNGVFNRNPALIVQCAGTSDAVQAVKFARSHNLLTAVKGGGHSLSGQSTCEGGLMIDMSLMRNISVDAAQRVAVADGGVLLGDLDEKNQAHGLVTPLGTAADTGIAGLTLGGGLGRVMRKYGLTCDNVLSVEIVTADGKVLRASEKDNADLFWGVRGGGGNFGVVTKFEYRLHPLNHPVLAGGKMYPIENAREVFETTLEIGARAPDELTISCGVFTMRPGGPIPAGKYAAAEMVYCGDPTEGEKHLAPSFAKLGKPALDTVATKSYVQAQLGPSGARPPALPPGLGIYIKSGFLHEFPDKLISDLIHAATNGPEWLEGIAYSALGGAAARVKPTATAYWNREAKFDILMTGSWFDHSKDAHNTAVLRDLWKTFEPYTKGYYVNTEPSESEQRLRATYGDNYPRLVQLKNKYDPKNLFRMNANIRPTTKA